MEQVQLPQKKFINEKENVVKEALEGFCLMNPDLAIIKDKQTITLKKKVENQVVLLCGGGSGHEPAHGGFVDDSMLHAAVCGGVFASPSYQQVYGAIQHIGQKSNGVLVIIKNYTGDVINFELAAGFSRTTGIDVKTLVVGDDIAFAKNSQDSEKISEARGLSGTVLLYKILGAAAKLGKSLDFIHQFGQRILKNMFSLGVSLSSCSLPGMPANFQLGKNEVEIGLGIHGEQGKGRQNYTKVNEIVRQMIEENFLNKFIKSGDSVVVLLNNLGSCTDLEMAIFGKEVLQQLKSLNIKVERITEGRIMTSLEMQGVLLTILKLEEEIQEDVLQYLDLPVKTKHWNISKPCYEQPLVECDNLNQETFYTNEVKQLNKEGQAFKNMIKNIFEELQKKEKYFNELDSIVGDGDTGSGLERACTAVLKNLDFLQFDTQFSQSMIALGEIIANSFGGTSGPLYGNFLSQASTHLKQNINDNNQENFSKALLAGSSGIQVLGKAELGQRTMYDVIQPVSLEFQNLVTQNESSKKIAQQLQESAINWAKKTESLPAKKGRARYLGGKEVGNKDPGCELVVEWIKLVVQHLQ